MLEAGIQNISENSVRLKEKERESKRHDDSSVADMRIVNEDGDTSGVNSSEKQTSTLP